MASALAVGAAHGKKPHPVSIFGTTIVLYLALAKLLLHLLTASRYGIFRDEMYYLACAQRRIVHQCNASFSCDSAK
jgi:hypothetical protein